MYLWQTPQPVTVPRIMENQMEKTTEHELETGVISEVRDQKTQIRIKKHKNRFKKKQ